tara:strand:- start:1137 stop:2051 length:915 start_codon:yes stop_codon:yes gene_type:complete
MGPNLKSKIILIAGPTASGKSGFAIKLSNKIDGEIINSDSMQIYKELKILTARPKASEYNNIKHHLYGFQSVKKNFSTGDWLKLAINKINEVKKKKKTPVIVGGTGLYFKALTEGLVKIPNIPIGFRKKIRLIQKKLGQKKFFEKLTKLDPLIINKINPTDTQRSIRAYEVKSYTKKSLIDWFKNTKPKYREDDFFKIYIDYPRSELLKKISKRAEQMIKDGAIKEVENFLNLKIKKDKTSNKVIGIGEIRDFLLKKTTLIEVKERISIKTRQYAKRQSTWARGHMLNWHRVKPKDLNIFLKKL